MKCPRSGASGVAGKICLPLFQRDGLTTYPAVIEKPIAYECDFWLCTCYSDANDEHFFGPRAA